MEATVDDLRRLLRYEPDTGRLFWRARPESMFSDGFRTKEGNCANWNARYSGKEAISANNGAGYLVGAVFGKKVYAHRVCWAIHHGDNPETIDHINGRRDDNRICNLRSVTQAENARNGALNRNNKSGHVGVSWHSGCGLWRASIGLDGKTQHLGLFRELKDAVAARSAAQAERFHPNHGRQA